MPVIAIRQRQRSNLPIKNSSFNEIASSLYIHYNLKIVLAPRNDDHSLTTFTLLSTNAVRSLPFNMPWDNKARS